MRGGGSTTCRDDGIPHEHAEAVIPSAGTPSAGGVGGPDSSEPTASVRLRDFTGWVLNFSEAQKLAKRFGPFSHTYCGLTKGEGATLAATSYPSEQFGDVCDFTQALPVDIERANVLVVAPGRSAKLVFQNCLRDGLTGIMVLPKWTKASWWPLVLRYQVVHEYPSGTPDLFISPPVKPGEAAVTMPDLGFSYVVVRVAPKPRNYSPRGLGPTMEIPEEPTMQAQELHVVGTENSVIRLAAKVRGQVISVLVDSGASEDYVSAALVTSLKLPVVEGEPTSVRLGDGHRGDASFVVPRLTYRVKSFKDTRSFRVTKLAGYDIILGKPWLTQFNPSIDWVANSVRFWHKAVQFILEPPKQSDEGVSLIKPQKLAKLLRQGERCFMAVVSEVCERESTLSSAESTASHGASGDLEAQFPSAFKDTIQEVKPAMQRVLQRFGKLFGPLPKRLPPQRDVDHEIELGPGTKPPFLPIYHLSPRELEEVKEQLTNLLESGFIQASKSPFGAPIIFVPKKNGKLRMCVDYRALNAITVKNRYPLPRIDELLDRLQGASVFTKLDLQSGYWQIRIKEEDVSKTAFRTRYGHYEWKVLPFGLTNAPATFQALMNRVFHPYMDQFVVVYLDDILVFSKTPEEHVRHLEAVLTVLEQNELYVGADKCAFGVPQVDFLGHVVSGAGVQPDGAKIQSVMVWPVPKTVREVRQFLGLTGYYRRFIQHYSGKALPLTELTKGNVSWQWGDAQQQAFEQLKHALATAPVLALPDPTLPYQVYTDASQFALGAVLLQDQGKGQQPVAYLSRKLNEAERRYPIGDKEMLAIFYALQEWRCYLEGVQFTVNSDHLNHTWFATKRELSRRQAKWSLWMESYYGPVDIKYKEGPKNLSDPLSRRPDLAAMEASTPICSDKILERIRDGYKDDAQFSSPPPTLRRDDDAGLWYFQERVAVPDDKNLRQAIIAELHDCPSAGHLGVTKTLQRVARRFYWPHMGRSVHTYVTACSKCQLNKPSHQVPLGTLQPLPVPADKFEMITMDFITDLPLVSSGFDAVFTVVDRLTKLTRFIPIRKDATAKDVAIVFRREWVKLFGIPKVIVSDRDPKFVSHFWKALFSALGTELRFSTAFHPQTDGQSERANRTLEEYLRHFVNPRQDNWHEFLDLAEFAINDSVNPSTGYSAYYLAYGRHPTTPLDLAMPDAMVPAAQTAVDEMAHVLAHARAKLEEARVRMARLADASRQEFSFSVGDKVKLSTVNLSLPATLSKKFKAKFVGPYEVVRVVSQVAYKLKLPRHLSIHPVFHVSLLRPWRTDSEFPSHTPVYTRPPPVDVGENRFEVESLLKKRYRRLGRGGRWEYLVRWRGYGPDDDTWEPVNNIDRSLVDAFEARA